MLGTRWVGLQTKLVRLTFGERYILEMKQRVVEFDLRSRGAFLRDTGLECPPGDIASVNSSRAVPFSGTALMYRTTPTDHHAS